MQEPAVVSSFGRVRRVFWIGFVAAILLALSVPAVTLWRDAATALQVEAYIQPASPRAGEAAHVVIVVPDAADRTDILNPASQIAARWDMLNMTMGTRESALPGPPSHSDSLTLPLHLDMPGPWWVQVAVHVPGRPAWQTRLDITVQPPVAMEQSAELAVFQNAPETAPRPEATNHLSSPTGIRSACTIRPQKRATRAVSV